MNQNGRTARGYGYRHQLARKRWSALVKAGECTCTRCGRMIVPGTPWHLDHTEDRTGYLGAAHATCNVKAGARKGARASNRKRPKRRWQSRAW